MRSCVWGCSGVDSSGLRGSSTVFATSAFYSPVPVTARRARPSAVGSKMVYRETHPAHALEDIREEFGLFQSDFEHIYWLLTGGMLTPTDVRTMLARKAVASLDERHGLDTNMWPSLARVDLSPSAKAKSAHAPPMPSHRDGVPSRETSGRRRTPAGRPR